MDAGKLAHLCMGPVNWPRDKVSSRQPEISPILSFWPAFNPKMRDCYLT